MYKRKNKKVLDKYISICYIIITKGKKKEIKKMKLFKRNKKENKKEEYAVYVCDYPALYSKCVKVFENREDAEKLAKEYNEKYSEFGVEYIVL